MTVRHCLAGAVFVACACVPPSQQHGEHTVPDSPPVGAPEAAAIALDSSNVLLRCGGAGPVEGRAAGGESNVGFERIDARCTWDGVQLSIFERSTDDALFYQPPFKPIRLEAAALADPSGRTLHLRLEPVIPIEELHCDADAALGTRIRRAQPLQLDAVLLALSDPITSSSCTLRPPGMSHQFTSAESVQITFPDAASATRVLEHVRAQPNSLAVRVRYAVHGMRATPRCRVHHDRLQTLDVRSLVTQSRDAEGGGVLSPSSTYVTSRALNELRARLRERATSVVSHFEPHECPPDAADRFVDWAVAQWEQELTSADEFRVALDQAIAAQRPDGDQAALAECRRYVNQRVSAGVSIGVVVGEIESEASRGDGATNMPCTGTFELHKLRLSDLDASGLENLLIQDFAVAGIAGEVIARYGTAADACAMRCAGCCTTDGTCVLPPQQTDQACGQGEPGRPCAACAPDLRCGENACASPSLDQMRFRVRLTSAHIEALCDTSHTDCDLHLTVESASGAPPERFTGRRDTPNMTPNLTLAEGTRQEVEGAWVLRFQDLDIAFHDQLGACEVRVDPTWAQNAASAPNGRFETGVECLNASSNVTIEIQAARGR